MIDERQKIRLAVERLGLFARFALRARQAHDRAPDREGGDEPLAGLTVREFVRSWAAHAGPRRRLGGRAGRGHGRGLGAMMGWMTYGKRKFEAQGRGDAPADPAARRGDEGAAAADRRGHARLRCVPGGPRDAEGHGRRAAARHAAMQAGLKAPCSAARGDADRRPRLGADARDGPRGNFASRSDLEVGAALEAGIWGASATSRSTSRLRGRGLPARDRRRGRDARGARGGDARRRARDARRPKD